MATRSEIKPDEHGLALRIAMGAMRAANSAATAKAGSVYIPNGDGTGTLIGELAGTDGTGGANGVAPWVGDTTPPGRPSGISCSSAWGTLYVRWDGTLEGGVPADFAYVSVLVDGVEIERLTGAGTAVREDLENGSTVQVTAVAYDAARDSLGNPAPNASEPWGPVSVAISDERAEIDAEVDQIRQDAEEMGAKVDKVAGDAAEALEKAQETVEQVTADVAEAKEQAKAAEDAAADAKATADGYAQRIDDATATVNGVKQDVSALTTKVEGAVEDAAGALSAASKAQQDVTGFKSEVAQKYQPKGDYASSSDLKSYATKTEVEQTAGEIRQAAEAATETAQGALTQATQAVQTATGVKTTLETDYVSKDDASATYSTKAELSATSSKLTASITEAAKTAEAAQDKALEVEATASGIKTTITQVSSKADAAQKDADAAQSTADGAVKQVTALEATVDGVSSAVTKAQSTADSAVSAASKAQQTVDGFKTEVSQKYQPKGDYASKGDLSGYQPKGDYATKSSVEQTATQIKQQVADTYATKTALDQERTDRQSAITQSATQVKSEVSSTYLKKSDASSTYATKASLSSYATKSSVDQTASQIKSEVAATYATQEDVDGISVGGTNLLLGTKAFTNSGYASTENGYLRSGWTVQSEKYQGLTVRGGTKSGTAQQVVGEWLVNEFALGEEFTLSFWVKGTGSKVRAYFYGATGYATAMRVASSDGQAASGYGDGNTDLPVSSGWKRVWVTWRINSTGSTTVAKYALIRTDSTASGKTVYVCGAKLEKGNKPTDWSPAPEDMLSTADAAATYATKSSVTQTASEIKSEVATTYLSKTNASSTYATKTEMKQSDDSIKSTVSSVKTTADSALKKATTVEQTADGLEVKITSAVSTANTAKSTADSAKSTADSAKSTATTANSNATTAKNNASTALNRATYQYGTCSTAAATAAKAVTLSDFSLFTGATVQVKFTNANSAANPTLNVNSTGAKAIRAYNANLSASSAYNWVAGAVVTFVYDGTYWNIADGASLSKANSAQSKANSAATAASNAQSTANTANSTANAAKTAAANAQTAANNAAKTATNYLKFDTSGLCVGNHTTTLTYNTLIKSTGMEVRNGSTVLSSFGASLVELAKNSSGAQIKMCGGVALVKYDGTDLTVGGAHASFQATHPSSTSASSPPFATLNVDRGGTQRAAFGLRADSDGRPQPDVFFEGRRSDSTSILEALEFEKFAKRSCAPVKLWSGNLAKGKGFTFTTSGYEWDDFRLFAVKLDTDGCYLVGAGYPWNSNGGQVHLSCGFDNGSSSYLYTAQINRTGTKTGTYVSGSSHLISGTNDRGMNLTELWGVC